MFKHKMQEEKNKIDDGMMMILYDVLDEKLL